MKKYLLFFLVFVLIVSSSIFINVLLIQKGLLNNEKVEVNDSIAHLSVNAKSKLDKIYTVDLKIEIPTCLFGEITKDGRIRIENVENAEIVSSNTTSVTYYNCPSYIGEYKVLSTMHNHPNGDCRLSSQDLETYGKDINRGQLMLGLKCQEGYIFFILNKIGIKVEEW